MNYYPFHVGDYSAAAKHLSWDEDLAYRRLLDWYYVNERPLPLDLERVCRLAMAGSGDRRKAVETVLTEFFEQTPQGWRHARCDEEIERMQAKQGHAEERDQHEKTRMQKHRERRAAMFAALAEVGVYPAWNAKTGELEAAMKAANVTLPVTQRSDEVTALVTAPVTVASLPATAIPTPTPTPTPTPKKKEDKAQAPLIAFELPGWVPAEAWAGFVEMRKKARKPMTERARDLMLAKLKRMQDRGIDVAAVLDNSTSNAWTDVYEPKINGAAPRIDDGEYV